MRLVLLGTRGSTPTPGPEFVRYGGHTSCVAVYRDGDQQPHLVLDAGTGLVGLRMLLDGEPFRGDIVLTHLHWDHLQGLPFCPAVDRDDAVVRLHVPTADAAADVLELISRGFAPPHFPVSPRGLLGDWTFIGFDRGDVGVEAAGVTVQAAPIAHKGGYTVGLRVGVDGASVAYLPDHALTRLSAGPLYESARALVHRADVLMHDGQFTDSESARAEDYGHSTLSAVLDFADRCEVGRVVLTHHSPGRTDAELDLLAGSCAHTPGGRPVLFALQSASVEVRGRAAATA